jgi:hypothetical protein
MHKSLKMGVDSPSPSETDERQRIEVLKATVEHYVPDFVRAVADAAKIANALEKMVVIHQDSFAAGYDDDEYVLLGMAVKYGGLHGVNVTITGTNHETF